MFGVEVGPAVTVLGYSGGWGSMSVNGFMRREDSPDRLLQCTTRTAGEAVGRSGCAWALLAATVGGGGVCVWGGGVEAAAQGEAAAVRCVVLSERDRAPAAPASLWVAVTSRCPPR
ncbi:hypothetical protein PLESTF_000925600 [Pleodorina starrii]|nr:hypothetical protein PLESTF_000925600 [Pleodorina starrii]